MEWPGGVLAKLRLRLQARDGRAAILAFHNTVEHVSPEGGGDRSLHLLVDEFCELIDSLSDIPSLRFVSMTDLQEGASGHGISVAITFDDAYRGALRYALPELARRGLAATVFVAPDLLGVSSLWWDEMAQRSAERSPNRWQAARESALQPPAAGRQRLLSVSREVVEARSAEPHPDYGIGTFEELRDACSLGAFTVGCHSWSHACLPSLSSDELQEELVRSRTWLESSGLSWLPMHAFPYGRWSEREIERLRQLGYQRALRVTGGPVQLRDRGSFCLSRINVPAGISVRGLLMRVAGMRQ